MKLAEVFYFHLLVLFHFMFFDFSLHVYPPLFHDYLLSLYPVHITNHDATAAAILASSTFSITSVPDPAANPNPVPEAHRAA